MKIDTFYFSHDSNAMDDPKIVRLIDSLGMEGYGTFWALIELLRNQPTLTYPIESAIYKYRQWNTSIDKIKACILKFGLFEIQEEIFFSLYLNKRMELADKKRQKYVEAGRKGGLKRTLNQPITSDAKATVKQNQAKERKEKEKKVKESKEKREIIFPFDSNLFLENWNIWKEHRKESDRFSYKPIGEQAALKELVEISKGNEEIAIKIILQSISKGWKGFFELKNNNHGNKNDKFTADLQQATRNLANKYLNEIK